MFTLPTYALDPCVLLAKYLSPLRIGLARLQRASEWRAVCVCLALSAAVMPSSARADETISIPLLVPITGFLSIEGTSQRNGALLAADHAKAVLKEGVSLNTPVLDTATSPEAAVNAFLKAMREENVVAAVAPLFGPQMLALLPLAEEFEIPLLTVSGTAKVTELGNPWVFRFFPSDVVVKAAQARYALEELGVRRPAIIHQTTAYGQSGAAALTNTYEAAGITPTFTASFAPSDKDVLPILVRARATNPDALMLQLHAAPTALLVRQWGQSGRTPVIVAGSALHQPTTAALLEPADMSGAGAETCYLPTGATRPSMAAFLEAFEARFNRRPDGYAAGQYDAVTMAVTAINTDALTPGALRDALSTTSHEGIAMTYKSDGAGNMAHDAVIVCYDGKSRTPSVAKRYPNVLKSKP